MISGFSSGGFVVAWESEGQDGSGAGIFAQRVRVALVSADFEAGDLGAWSVSTGGGSSHDPRQKRSRS